MVAAGDVYNFPFMLLSDTGVVDECRQPGLVIASCDANFTNYKNSTSYSIEIIDSANFSSPGPITGCMKATTNSTCAVAPGHPVSQISASGQLEACRPAGSICPTTGGYSVLLLDYTTLTVLGCANFNNTGDCPAQVAGVNLLSVYAANPAQIPANGTYLPTRLSSCRAYTVLPVATCDNIALFGNASVEVVAGGALKGCSVPDANVSMAYCPYITWLPAKPGMAQPEAQAVHMCVCICLYVCCPCHVCISVGLLCSW